MLTASVSVSSDAPSIVGLQRLAILVSSFLSAYFNLSTSFSLGFPEFSGKGFDRDLPFRLSLCSITSNCKSVPQFPSVVVGNF